MATKTTPLPVLRQLVAELSQDSPVQVVVFLHRVCSDADLQTLRAIAEPSGGSGAHGRPGNHPGSVQRFFPRTSRGLWRRATLRQNWNSVPDGQFSSVPSIVGKAPSLSPVTLGLALLTLTGLIPAAVWYISVVVLAHPGSSGRDWPGLEQYKGAEFRAKAVAEMFRESFKTTDIHDQALRSPFEKALEYRDKIDEVIAKSRRGCDARPHGRRKAHASPSGWRTCTGWPGGSMPT